jgi:putative transposon-encoded protein
VKVKTLRLASLVRVLLVAALLLAGCASAPFFQAKEVVAPVAGGAVPAAQLTHSLFAKPLDRDNLSEEVIQRVLAAPVEPEFPARAGVVVLDAPFTRRAYASLEPGDEGPQVLAREIERSRHFVMVSDISPYLANGQHIESLREVATRYRLKYLIVLNTRYVDRSSYNHWGWGWLTLLAIPFLPAYTLQTAGLMEATLMDVQTGTFLFTTQIHLQARDRVTPFGTDAKLGELQRQAGRRAAELLARRFLGKCNRLVAEVARRKAAAVAATTSTSKGAGGTEAGASSSPSGQPAPRPGAPDGA